MGTVGNGMGNAQSELRALEQRVSQRRSLAQGPNIDSGMRREELKWFTLLD